MHLFQIAEHDREATFPVSASDIDSPIDTEDLCYDIEDENSPSKDVFGIYRNTVTRNIAP